jgi:protein-disulfide isomerase
MARQPGYLSFCDVSATISCTQVYQSRYALLSGVPVALLVFVLGASTALAFLPPLLKTQAGASGQAGTDRQSEFVRYWESLPRVQVPVSAEGAAVLIVKFSDFQCPACAQSYLDYKEILARYQAQYPGAIRFVQKDYPLETECNSNVPRDVHLAACEAAAAARLAHARGRGEAMDDWLFTNHATLTPASVRQAARDVAGVADFDAQYPSVLNQIKSDIALAAVMGIKVTPTFFVNGVRLEGGLPRAYFELALQMELKKAGKTTP